MYSPTIGRWLTPDPTGFEAGDVNLYRFVGNDPTDATDPSGLDELPFGGTTRTLPNFNLGGSVGRVLLDPDPKKTSLEGVPYLRKNDLPTPPNGSKIKNINGTEWWEGEVPQNGLVGPAGAGPCTGLIIVQERKGSKPWVMAFHFNAGNKITTTFSDTIPRNNFLVEYKSNKTITTMPNCKAYICGCEEPDKESNNQPLHSLEEVVAQLKKYQVPIAGYCPAPNIHVNSDGKPFWTTPGTLNIKAYDK